MFDPDDAVFARARAEVVAFQKLFEVPWDRFLLLGVTCGLSGLGPRRWAEAMQNNGIRPYAKTRMRTIELAEAIKRRKFDLLDAMDIPYHRKLPLQEFHAMHQSASSNGVTLGRTTPLNADDLCIQARLLASQGMHSVAFTTLLHWLDFYADHCPISALTVLETLFQAGSCYAKSVVFVEALRSRMTTIIALSTKVPPDIRWRCVAQIACVLSRRGRSEAAANLFSNRWVRELLDRGHKSFWYQPQLIRNRSLHLIKHAACEQDLKTAQRDVHDADPWPSYGNRRAIAAVQCLGHAKAGRVDRAWEVSEPYYEKDRRVLNESFAAGRLLDGELGHIFASVLRGTLARVISGRRFKNGELSQDLLAMRWCATKFCSSQHEISPLLTSSRFLKRDSELWEFASNCNAQPYSVEVTNLLEEILVILRPCE